MPYFAYIEPYIAELTRTLGFALFVWNAVGFYGDEIVVDVWYEKVNLNIMYLYHSQV